MLSAFEIGKEYERLVISSCIRNSAGRSYFDSIANYLRNGCVNSGEYNVQSYTLQHFSEEDGLLAINWVFPYKKLKRPHICQRIYLEPFDNGSLKKVGAIEENNEKIGNIITFYNREGIIEHEKVTDLDGTEIYLENMDGNSRTSCLLHPTLKGVIVVTRDGVEKYLQTSSDSPSIEDKIINSTEISKDEIERLQGSSR